MSIMAGANGAQSETGSWTGELRQLWQSLPGRGIFLILCLAWLALFHWAGNSTLGYVDTQSAFGWWFWVMTRGYTEGGLAQVMNGEEAHAWIMPGIVLGLLAWQRQALAALSKRVWWPALLLFAVAVLVHTLGFVVQQTRLSLIAFIIGLYAIMGLLWGREWLRETLFPFGLFAFWIPLGNSAEMITFPLRMLATDITVWLAQTVFGWDIIQRGTQILEPGGRFSYEVAAACSGIRSLTAIIALGLIYGYIGFRSTWRRLALLAAAFPLAVLGNVLRLLAIIMAAHVSGQAAGDSVHDSSLFSLLPYMPALAGFWALGWWIEEKNQETASLTGEPAGGPR